MVKKILLGILALIVGAAISGYFYFSAGSETYPVILSQAQAAPEFTGIDQHGETLRLSELVENGPVVLIFYRGFWCPACQQHLAEIQSSLESFTAQGARVLAITPELPEKTNENLPARESFVSIVHDAQNKIIQAYNVGYEPGKGTGRLLGLMGVNLQESNGNSQNTLPIPAIYVIGTDGKIKFTYEKAGGLAPKYLPVEEILDQLSD